MGLAPVILRWLCLLLQEHIDSHGDQHTHSSPIKHASQLGRALKEEWGLGLQRIEVTQGESSTARVWGPCGMKPFCRDHLIIWFGVGKGGMLPGDLRGAGAEL